MVGVELAGSMDWRRVDSGDLYCSILQVDQYRLVAADDCGMLTVDVDKSTSDCWRQCILDNGRSSDIQLFSRKRTRVEINTAVEHVFKTLNGNHLTPAFNPL